MCVCACMCVRACMHVCVHASVGHILRFVTIFVGHTYTVAKSDIIILRFTNISVGHI